MLAVLAVGWGELAVLALLAVLAWCYLCSLLVVVIVVRCFGPFPLPLMTFYWDNNRTTKTK